MCPSYMATREEKHSTRGRANVLRLAMAGRLGESGLGDDGVHEVLDLCLECRACKAECPVGVDVARFKSEFLADYWQRHGTPLQARAIGHVHTAVGVGQPRSRRCRTSSRAARRPLDQRTAARHRSPAHAAGLGARHVRAAVRATAAPPAARPPARSPQPCRACCSTTRSPTTTTRRSAWRPPTCSRPPASACGSRRTAAAAGR